MGFSRQEYRSGLPFPSPADLPDRDRTQISCTAGRFFTICVTGKAIVHILFRCKEKGNSSTCHTTWKNLDILSEIRWSCEDKCCIIPLTEVPREAKFIETESQMGVARDWSAMVNKLDTIYVFSWNLYFMGQGKKGNRQITRSSLCPSFPVFWAD